MAILVTGGAGFIGSHTCVEMLNAGYEVIVVDNLCNASEEAIRRVEKITGKNVTFYKADIRDKEALDQIFDKESVECVIHFAGLKAVGESVAKPLEYYQNNIANLQKRELSISGNSTRLCQKKSRKYRAPDVWHAASRSARRDR